MVGKTSLIQKFTKGSFKEDYLKTIGAQFSVYDKKIDRDKIRLLFWDIAGQDDSDFNFVRPTFFKHSKAAIIVFSLEENDLGENSFNQISNWHKDIIQFCGNIPVFLFANKVDLVDENTLDNSNIERVVNELNILKYYRTSAKTGQGVVIAFNFIIDMLYHENKTLLVE